MSERPKGITILTILVSINCVAEFIYAFMVLGSWLFSSIAILFFPLPILHLALAYGLWTKARWAWPLALALDFVFITFSVLSLIPYPFGVLLMYAYPLAILMYIVSFWLAVDFRLFIIFGVVVGVLFIWYLMQSYVKASFTKAPSATVTKQ